MGGNFQPLLAIEYEQNGPPNGVTDLEAADVDWYQLHMTWTAPSDQPPGPVASYDLRYSHSPIDDSNFDAATPVANMPVPAAPGTVQDVWVTGLQPETSYYLAMRCTDLVGFSSILSNVVNATTNVTDPVPPGQIVDLAAVDIRPNYVVLNWTAPGDDGSSGIASGYELRYSTAPIDAGNFAQATLVATEPAAGSRGERNAYPARSDVVDHLLFRHSQP